MRVKNKISIVCVFLIFGLNCALKAQKNIFVRSSQPTKGFKRYNISGADMFIILSNDTLFVPKTDKNKFVFPKKYYSYLDSHLEKKIKLIIEIDQFTFLTEISKEAFSMATDFSIEIFKARGTDNMKFGYANPEWIFQPLEVEVRKRKWKKWGNK